MIQHDGLGREKSYEPLTASMTAPVLGSCGLPACIARVPKLATGEGARGGVLIAPFVAEGDMQRYSRGEANMELRYGVYGGSSAFLLE